MSKPNLVRLVARCAAGRPVTVITREGRFELPLATQPEEPNPVQVEPAPQPPREDGEAIVAAIEKLGQQQDRVALGLEALVTQKRRIRFADGEEIVSEPLEETRP